MFFRTIAPSKFLHTPEIITLVHPSAEVRAQSARIPCSIVSSAKDVYRLLPRSRPASANQLEKGLLLLTAACMFQMYHARAFVNILEKLQMIVPYLA